MTFGPQQTSYVIDLPTQSVSGFAFVGAAKSVPGELMLKYTDCLAQILVYEAGLRGMPANDPMPVGEEIVMPYVLGPTAGQAVEPKQETGWGEAFGKLLGI